jgi:hypothetical protein
MATAVVVAAVCLHLSPSGIHPVMLMGIELPDVCPLHRLTGIWCPGCGLTRAFVSMAHGDVRRAFGFNPLGPLLFEAVVAAIPLQIFLLVAPKTALRFDFANIADWLKGTVLAALLLLGAYRLGWGLTHLTLSELDREPPSNWHSALLLVFGSVLLFAGVRAARSRGRGRQRERPCAGTR